MSLGIFAAKLPLEKEIKCAYCNGPFEGIVAMYSSEHDWYLHHIPLGCVWKFLRTTEGGEVIRHEGAIIIPDSSIPLEEFYKLQGKVKDHGHGSSTD